MPNEKDVNLGTAAEDRPAAQSGAPDMDRYYYPPGTTEPVLRPEFANAPAPKDAAAETKDTPATPNKAEQDKGKQ